MTEPSTALATIETGRNVDTFALAVEAWPLAERLAKSPEFVPKGMMNRPEAVLAVMLRGAELGVSPMVALAQMHVIDGRVGLSAELLRAIVLAAGHELYPQDVTNTRVTMCARRKGTTGDPIKVTWTEDDAKKAGLIGKDNWRKYQRQMLTARATAEIVRLVFPDVVGGLQAVEELWDIDGESWEDDDGAPPPPPPAKATTRKAAGATARPRKRAAPKAAEPVDEGGPPLPPLPHELHDDAPATRPQPVATDHGEASGGDSAPPPEAGVDDLATRRASQIAMKCNDLGLDRADVIYAVTQGRHTSAKAVAAEVDLATAVLEAIRQIRVGEARLDTSGDEPVIVAVDPTEVVDAEVVDDDDAPFTWEDSVGAEGLWKEQTWREYLAHKGLKLVPVIKEAKRIAAELGEPEPMNLAGLEGTSYASTLRAWCEEQAST